MLSPGLTRRVIEVPQLGPLVLGVPLAGAVAKGKDALLGAGFFFVPAGSAEGGVEAVGAQAIEQGGGLEQSAAAAGSQRDRIGAVSNRVFIAPHQQLDAELAGVLIAKGDHLAEFVTGIDMQERKRNGPGIEGLLRQPQHDGRVLADGVEHHRLLKLGRHFAEDVDALRLQHLEMAQLRSGAYRHGFEIQGWGLTNWLLPVLRSNKKPLARGWQRLWLLSLSYAKELVGIPYLSAMKTHTRSCCNDNRTTLVTATTASGMMQSLHQDLILLPGWPFVKPSVATEETSELAKVTDIPFTYKDS